MAGGSGFRLHPITVGLSKQLLPIYDKPMIYYPISVLMLSGIRDILIITTPRDLLSFQTLLGGGEQFGVSFEYAVQREPSGLAQAFVIGESFIIGKRVALVLGDNIFYGHQFSDYLKAAINREVGATIFGYHVNNPENFGVIGFDENGEINSLDEKPIDPASNWAATGLYFYDDNVLEISKSILPSSRGELEITDINKVYLKKGDLTVDLLGRGFAWLDTGTPESLLDAGHFVQTVEQRQGLKIACLEEIAYHQGWISNQRLMQQAEKHKQTSYGEYLRKVASGSR